MARRREVVSRDKCSVANSSLSKQLHQLFMYVSVSPRRRRRRRRRRRLRAYKLIGTTTNSYDCTAQVTRRIKSHCQNIRISIALPTEINMGWVNSRVGLGQIFSLSRRLGPIFLCQKCCKKRGSASVIVL